MKVVIVYSKLNIGGAERSTVALANGFKEAGHDVTMFLKTCGGALEKELLPGIKIMHFYHDTGALKEWNRSISGLFTISPFNLFDAARQYICGQLRKIYYCISKPQFDLGITSFNGIPASVLNKYTRCKVRIKMIRSERPFVFKGVPAVNTKVFENELKGCELEAFVCVSKKLREVMLQYCNIPSDRVFAIYNLKKPLDDSVRQMGEPAEYMGMDGIFKIVTVARLHEATKGLVRMVEVADALIKKEYHFKWFVVGDGIDRQMFEATIKNHQLEDTFVLCGFKAKPYNYYQYADLVAVLSYVEGFCGSVTEAKLMEKPIIVTNFAVKEQIENGVNGLIVENNHEAIIAGLEKLLSDGEFRESLAVNGLSQEILDNGYKIKQFEELYNHFRKQNV